MISEVPLGAFLSGGVDSSAVVASMAGLSPEPVNTCSIAFTDPQYDEAEFARLVAERYATRHHRRDRRQRRLRPRRHAGPPLRRTVRRQLGDPDLPRLPARAPARDRGAVGRRR
jgi:asparagine synthetase B (glutamine-hydrolysing)